ncbi:MAG: hypothetical protein LBR28_02330 [Bacteroidales bacterium]|jgi:Leucine-rich repeat (LRR) protein|nr:hypothetical protein [Bacteroidales bacterium]
MPNKFLNLILTTLLIYNTAFSQGKTFYSIEDAIKTPDSVKVLILNRQHLKSIPNEIYLFINLESLSLSRNKIENISDSLSLLKKLHYLDLSSNYISFLPCSLTRLPLDTLIIWDNPIYVFDTCFADLKLKYLDLRAIEMNKKEQQQIISLFPQTKIRKNRPCNCRGR